jgi:hypothetical protein
MVDHIVAVSLEEQTDVFLSLTSSSSSSILMVDVIVAALYHTHSAGLLWTRDQPITETSS